MDRRRSRGNAQGTHLAGSSVASASPGLGARLSASLTALLRLPGAGEKDGPPSPAGGRKENLVVVAPALYHPACGDAYGISAYRLVRRLAPIYEIHFIAFAQAPHDIEGGRQALASVCSSITAVAVPRSRRGASTTALRWLRGEPACAHALSSSEMSARIADLVLRSTPSAVLILGAEMAQYAASVDTVPVIVEVQEAGSAMAYRAWQRGRGLSRLTRFFEWLAWLRYEQQHYTRARALLAPDEDARGALASFFSSLACHYSPVAVDIAMTRPAERKHYAALTGNFSLPRHREALNWLLDEVWPKVRQRVPGAMLHIAGLDIPPRARRMMGTGVHVVGYLENTERFLDDAVMALLPCQISSGLELRAVEAMARACPLVTTSCGARGLKGEAGRHYLVADDARAYADAMSLLFESPHAADALGTAGQEHAAKHFSWPAKMGSLVSLIRSLGRGRAPAVVRHAGS